MTRGANVAFDNTYAKLPDRLFARQAPTPVSAPRLVRVNGPLAQRLRMDPAWLESNEGLAMLAGNRVEAGSEPIALAYAGHQFGNWVPRLGDGRAILLGEVRADDGERYDIQLKGSGRTPFSRGGDGRAPLGPVLREYVVSEAMAALGIPTTRALAAVTTGDMVHRQSSQPGGVLTRVARSHIRIGTFELFAAQRDVDALRLLADHAIARHFPTAAGAAAPYRAMFEEVVTRTAELIARWQLIGFIHGVMNTDNMLLSGETIDYGPCAFMDRFHVQTVYSSIDHGGRYAYGNQPRIAHWNLGSLAQALLPILADDQEAALGWAQQAIDAFGEQFTRSYQHGVRRKIGLDPSSAADDSLIDELFRLMGDTQADFTLTFRALADLAGPAGAPDAAATFELPAPFAPWVERWRRRLEEVSPDAQARGDAMHTVNPVFIPRNHLVQEVIDAAVTDDDFAPFHALVDRLAQPYTYADRDRRFALPPEAHQIVRQTFCGT